MRDRKKSFRHHSLQDEKSLQDILKAVSSGIARGKTTFSDEDEKIVTFAWENLKSENGGKLNISFKTTVQLTENGLVFSAEIDNQSEYVVETIRWPQFGDLSIPKNSEEFSQTGIDYGGMDKFEIYPKFQNEPGYFAVDNPSNWMESPTTPFVLL